jgi:hypothetical protein
MRLRKLLIVSIFLLSTLLIIWVFVMLKPTYRNSYVGCGVTGCGVPQQSLGPLILEELTKWVGRTQSIR